MLPQLNKEPVGKDKKKKRKTIRHSSNMSEQLQENMSTQGLEESNLIRAHPTV